MTKIPSDAGGAAAPQPQSEAGKFYNANRRFRSTTDPDATLVRHGGLKSRTALQDPTHLQLKEAPEHPCRFSSLKGGRSDSIQ
jgi:hypothetical protein